MKKLLLALIAVALISLPIVMISCEEDNPVNCSAEYTDLLNQGNRSCTEYKQDLQDYIDKDCSAIYDNVLELIIDGLDC